MLLNVRRAFSDEFELRGEHEWPLARTRWTRLYLDADAERARWEAPAGAASVSFEAMGEPFTLRLGAVGAGRPRSPGPLAATLLV